MSQLPELICPTCCGPIAASAYSGKVPRTTQFDDCLRRCERCGIGASNTAHSKTVTFIHRDPLNNIPLQSRDGASEALANALNVRNRESKRRRFGFSTSEDAVTWVVFTYLLRSGQLLRALRRANLVADETAPAPSLLLWGTPIGNYARGDEIRKQLRDLCARLKEAPNSFSEPDVIIDLEEKGLIFIEVKHLSGNEWRKKPDHPGWSRYESISQLGWRFYDVKASGAYELARNWCLLKNLAGKRSASLVNLGPDKLFRGANGERLDRFISALGIDERPFFRKVTWSDLLGKDFCNMPEWLVQFCRRRGLMN